MEIRCFVAMAFDREDTDNIYKAVKKTLKHASRRLKGCPNIVPVRVDKIEHNDDIDDRIIHEIDAADFVIADLTYARPSVYFEAGYAQRQVPVVYTCRRDHFRRDASDDRRVHFDLLMKNIISWRDPEDATFPQRLASRVVKVVLPILREKDATAVAAAARSSFFRLPVAQRVKELLERGASVLSGTSWESSRSLIEIRDWLKENIPPGSRTSSARALLARLTDLTRHAGIIVVRKDKGRVSRHVALLVAESFSDSDLAAVRNATVAAAPWDCRLRRRGKPQRIEDTLLLCSMSPVPDRRVARAFPDFGRDAAGAFTGSRRLPVATVVNDGRYVANVLLPSRDYVDERDGAVVFAEHGRRCWSWDSYWRSALARDQFEEAVDLPTIMTDRKITIRVVSEINSVRDFERRLRELELR